MFALYKFRPTHAAIGLLSAAMLLSTQSASARDEVACRQFETSEMLQENLDALFELGDCQAAAGLSASAYHTFLEAQAVASAKRDRARAERAAERVAALSPQLTEVVFKLPKASRVPGLTIRLGENAVPSSSWERPIPVNAGILRVSAAAKGYRPWSIEIDARHSPGQQFQIDVPVLTRSQDAQRQTSRGQAYRTAGVVTGSVGLAGLGAGALFSALSRNADGTRGCPKGTNPCKSGGATYGDAAAVSFALGGALLAGGVTLFVLAPSADNQEKHALRVAARYASSGGRVQLEGVW